MGVLSSVASLKGAADRHEPHAWPTALVLPMDRCPHEDRWFDNVGRHEIRSGTRAFLGGLRMQFSGNWFAPLITGFQGWRLPA
jgi:hypothetical protein